MSSNEPNQSTIAASDGQGEISSRPLLLVAYDGSPMSESQLHLACRSANDIGALVRALYVIVRSRHIPLDVPLSHDEESEANTVLERAQHIADRYSVLCEQAVECARSVSEAIIVEARDSAAQTIFIGLRDRKRRGTALLLSATLRHVLQHAPCPVQIGYLPAELPEQLAQGAEKARV